MAGMRCHAGEYRHAAKQRMMRVAFAEREDRPLLWQACRFCR
jgi:hypothetical protein